MAAYINLYAVLREVIGWTPNLHFSPRVELLQSRVMLLRVLLLNHTCAMIGSIAVFKSALNCILSFDNRDLH